MLEIYQIYEMMEFATHTLQNSRLISKKYIRKVWCLSLTKKLLNEMINAAHPRSAKSATLIAAQACEMIEVANRILVLLK